MTKDCAKFAAGIHTCLKDQIAKRDMLDRHLAQKARLSNAHHTDVQGRKFDLAEQELKSAYNRHKTETLARIGSIVKK
jgi:hypothetical protein